jgi:hypothetical protein
MIQGERGGVAAIEEVPALTNKDYFFDWEGD